MKRILEKCSRGRKGSNTNDDDEVKLRLRGKGSGRKEGPDSKESNDPMHLCVSGKDKEKFDLACELAEDLLKDIYRNYAKHTGKPPLKIKLLENSRQEGGKGTSLSTSGYREFKPMKTSGKSFVPRSSN